MLVLDSLTLGCMPLNHSGRALIKMSGTPIIHEYMGSISVNTMVGPQCNNLGGCIPSGYRLKSLR